MTAVRAVAAACGLVALVTVGAASGCKTGAPAAAPPVAAPPAPAVSLDQKVAWILRLEQSRSLRDGPALAAAAPPAVTARPFIAATSADLTALALDLDPAIRGRAVLAMGRVGQLDGITAVTHALTDPEESVRVQAAFALGLIGAKSTVGTLEQALGDPSAAVRGRAIEALGLIGDAAAATPIAAASSGCGARLSSMAPDDEEWPKTPEIDACRLALFALARLKNYDAVAQVIFGAHGELTSQWWPVAYALQRVADKRAADALVELSQTPGVDTASFAIKGLAALHDARVEPVAETLASHVDTDIRLRVTAVRALGQMGGAAAISTLLAIAEDRSSPRDLLLEAVTALGRAHASGAFDLLLDLATDSWPTLRAAALGSAAEVNPDGFLLVAPSLGTDRDWSVRAAIAGVFATLPADRVRGAIEDLSADQDVRVRAPALTALAKIGAPDLSEKLFAALEAPDFALRATAAHLVGAHKPDGGAAKLAAAYTRGLTDATYEARVAALEAVAAYGAAEATAVLHQALADADWPVRTRAADLLHTLGEAAAQPVRPAPLRQNATYFESAKLLHPQYSPHALIDVAGGTIELELDVVNAPFTSASFVELARAGFFNGIKIHRVVPDFVVQAGDPRGDGEGGPGYSVRDEFSPVPYLRGTVGMALDFPETGGSQFFITLSPQPHLDDKYTVFARVVKGFEFLDGIAQGDVIQRVRIWDGVTFE